MSDLEVAHRPKTGPRLALAVLACALAATAAVPASAAAHPARKHRATSVDQAARKLLPASILSRGTLIDGINLPNPPMEYTNPGSSTPTGFDIDVAKSIAAKLGLKLTFSNVAFVQLLPSLGTGRLDFMLSGLSDLPSRRGVADWIDYFRSGARIFTMKSSSSKVPNLQALCGQTVETAVGTSYVQELPQLSASLCKGKAPIKVLAVGGSLAEEEIQVKTGRAIAAVTAPENFGYLSKSVQGDWVPVGGIFAPSLYGIAVKKGNTPVRNAIAAAFRDTIKEGTYMKLARKWKQEASAVSTVTINKGK